MNWEKFHCLLPTDNNNNGLIMANNNNNVYKIAISGCECVPKKGESSDCSH